MTGTLDEQWRRLLDLSKVARELRREMTREPMREQACGAARNRLREHLEGAGFSDPLVSAVYAPLIARSLESPLVVAQVGQSIDAHIATESGHSHYINGEMALDHLHRLRALVDAVVVGASTVVLDDPRLTTRRVPGPNPTRVVIDPHGRVPADCHVYDGEAPTLRLKARDPDAPAGAHKGNAGTALLDAADGTFRPADILEALGTRGLSMLLVEGGGATISSFLWARALHRLHVMVAPLIIGPGRPAFRLPAIERLDQARRFRMAAYPLGTDVLLACDLEAPMQR